MRRLPIEWWANELVERWKESKKDKEGKTGGKHNMCLANEFCPVCGRKGKPAKPNWYEWGTSQISRNTC